MPLTRGRTRREGQEDAPAARVPRRPPDPNRDRDWETATALKLGWGLVDLSRVAYTAFENGNPSKLVEFGRGDALHAAAEALMVYRGLPDDVGETPGEEALFQVEANPAGARLVLRNHR